MRALLCVVLALASTALAQPPRWLWYKQPAASWSEALPVGNGRIGAMVFGGIQRERIQLNEDSLWAGSHIDRDRQGASQHLGKARELLFAGDYAAAEKLVQKQFMSERWVRSHQTLGDLTLEFAGHENATDYRRELDLGNAVAMTTYRIGDTTYRREVFCSAMEQALVVHLTSDGVEPFVFEVWLARQESSRTEQVDDRTLRLSGQANAGKEHTGTKFVAWLRVSAGDVIRAGESAAGKLRLVVRAKREAVLVLTAATSFGSGIGLIEEVDPEAALANARAELDAVSERSVADMRRTHTADHRQLFDRVEIDLAGQAMRGLPTDIRLERVKKGTNDPDLTATHFQFGRYLLIASSRQLSMPANLQGLWNEHIDAPWNADYHININLQMNYWPAEVCNLSE